MRHPGGEVFTPRAVEAGILFSLVAVAAFWLVWVLVRPANVVRVDGAAVYVQYLPLTTEGKISWWNDNKDKLQEKYHIIKDESHFTVARNEF
ncbi:DUF943 family protein [Serratia ureilytica]|nr:DUF943 family protein [Serratia ureilytica]